MLPKIFGGEGRIFENGFSILSFGQNRPCLVFLEPFFHLLSKFRGFIAIQWKKKQKGYFPDFGGGRGEFFSHRRVVGC